MEIKTKNNTNLATIAQTIRKDWKNIYFGAEPYLEAMSRLHGIEDHYGADSAKNIVNYFLANAGTWRGKTAEKIKTEVKRLVKS